MEGVSDAVARAVLSELGGMDACVTEFLRVTDRPASVRSLRESCPELDTGGRTRAGVPVLVQLLGSRPDVLAETAVRAIELGAPGIDLNFGCPAKRVNGHDGGAALLRTPERIENAVAAVRRAVPLDKPVSAKIRLGWENPDDVYEVARAAEAAGASWLTIHGRTKVQMYKPHADWGRIGETTQQVGLPVVANGDIFDADALRRCAEVTGCTAFMVGRGAFRVPNLFRWARGWDDEAWPPARSAEMLRAFVAAVPSLKNWRSPERATLARLKQWIRYLSEVNEEMRVCFDVLKRTQTLDDALAALERFFPRSKTDTARRAAS